MCVCSKIDDKKEALEEFTIEIPIKDKIAKEVILDDSNNSPTMNKSFSSLCKSSSLTSKDRKWKSKNVCGQDFITIIINLHNGLLHY